MARCEVDLVVNITDPVTGRLSVAANKTVKIYLRNTDGSNGSLATLYTTPNLGTTKSNPTLTTAYGQIDAWVDQGSYNIEVSGTGISTYSQSWDALPASTIYNQHKQAVRAASTTNHNIASPGATVDSVTLVASDRILLTAQTTSSQNGIWVWNGATSALTRPGDFNSTISSAFNGGSNVYVLEGTANVRSYWTLTTANPVLIDTTNQTWTKQPFDGTVTLSKVDPTVWGTVNAKGTIAARPASTTSGYSYFATDVSGGTQYRYNGSSWDQISAGLNGANPPRAFVYASASTALSPMPFDSEFLDTDTIHDTVTNNSRLTCRTAGTYLVGSNISNTSTGLYPFQLKVNGTTGYAGGYAYGGTASLSALIPMSVNDYVEVFNLNGVSVVSGGTILATFYMIKVA